jgi:hypothetical protein
VSLSTIFLSLWQVRRVVDSIRIETLGARSIGQSMFDIAAHVLTNSVERAAAGAGGAPAGSTAAANSTRALAVSDTSRSGELCVHCVDVVGILIVGYEAHIHERKGYPMP